MQLFSRKLFKERILTENRLKLPTDKFSKTFEKSDFPKSIPNISICIYFQDKLSERDVFNENRQKVPTDKFSKIFENPDFPKLIPKT